MKLRERMIHTPLPNMNKVAHSGFETQRRHHQKFKTEVSMAPQKNSSPQNFVKIMIGCNMDDGTFCANAFMTVEVDTMMYDHQNSI